MFLETFISGVNEIVFAVGYTVIITSLAFLAGSVANTLIKRKKNQVSA